jgi:signal transduction histidine kinase
MKKSKLTRTIFFGLFSLFTFLVLLLLANYSLRYIDIEFYTAIVYFFNVNIRVVILISLLFLFSRISELFLVPINLFSPFFKAIGAGMLIIFLSSILKFILQLGDTSFPFILKWINVLTEPLVLFVAGIIFVVGYFRILYRELMHSPKKEEKEEKRREEKKERPFLKKVEAVFDKLVLKIKQRLS